MQPLVLLYNLPTGTPAGDALHRIFLVRGIASRDIPESQLGLTVGNLLGTDSAASDAATFVSGAEVRDSHLMLMCGFDESLLDQFLADMRAAGVRIPHKAMLTPTNAGFTVAQLISDIAREHQMMQQMRQMQ